MDEARQVVGRGGYNGPQTTRAVPATLIGETTDEIASAAKRVSVAAAALRDFNDGIHGSQPRQEGGLGNQINPPGPQPRAERIRNEVRSLTSALAELEGEISRLDRI